MIDYIVAHSRQFVNIFFYVAIIVFPAISTFFVFISEKARNPMRRKWLAYLSMIFLVGGAGYAVLVTVLIYWLTVNISITEKIFITGGVLFYLIKIPRLLSVLPYNKMYTLMGAIRDGDYTTVQNILKSGFNPNTRIQPDNRLTLHLAAASGHKEIVDLLLMYGAHADDLSMGQTALIAATANRHADVVKRLLEANADPNIRSQQDDLPLYIAASFGLKDIVDLLLMHGAEVDAICLGQTALAQATAQGHTDVVKQLLEAKADPNIRNQPGNLLALHLAVQFRYKDIVDLLLMHGAKVDAEYSGRTALVEAIKSNNIDMVTRLLEAKADPNRRISEGITPLDYAIEKNNRQIVATLVRAGAAPYSEVNGPITSAHLRIMKSEGKKIFISYRTVDVQFVRLIVEQLMARGVPIWFDEYYLSTSQKEQILKDVKAFENIINLAINESESAICFTNQSYANSPYCKREASILTSKLPLDRILNIACPEYQELYSDVPQLRESPKVHLQHYPDLLHEANLEELWRNVSEYCFIPYKPLSLKNDASEVVIMEWLDSVQYSLDVGGWQGTKVFEQRKDTISDVIGGRFMRTIGKLNIELMIVVGLADGEPRENFTERAAFIVATGKEWDDYMTNNELQKSTKPVGFHFQNIQGDGHASFSTYDEGMDLWMRHYVIILPNPAFKKTQNKGDSQLRKQYPLLYRELEFSLQFSLRKATFQEFCSIGYLMDRVALSLKILPMVGVRYTQNGHKLRFYKD